MDAFGGGAGAEDVGVEVQVALEEMSEPCFSHLGAGAVSGAEDEDARLRYGFF